MAMFWDVELDARAGRHHLAVINQQADYLGIIAWDPATESYAYVPALVADCPSGMLEVALEKLPQRDRELGEERELDAELREFRTLRRDDQWARVIGIFREHPGHAYEAFVSAWRAHAHPAVIEMALEVLCRDVWRGGFKYLQGSPARWLERDARWLALAQKLTKAVRRSTALDALVHEIVNRDALLARANEHLRGKGGVARYAKITALAQHAESVASVRAWKQALEHQDAPRDALERLREAGLEPLEPRPRVLCEDLISALGAHRHQPAIAWLAQLWERGQRELRLRSGFALLAYDTNDAYDVLSSGLPDLEPPFLRIAITAELQREPLGAFDRLSAHIDEETFLLELVDALHRDHRRRQHDRPPWFEMDPRWRELLAPLARRTSNPQSPRDQIAVLAYELLRASYTSAEG